jgi:hypothetical protein
MRGQRRTLAGRFGDLRRGHFRLSDVARFVLRSRGESCGKHRTFPARNLGSGDPLNVGFFPRLVNGALWGLLQPNGEPILDGNPLAVVH